MTLSAVIIILREVLEAALLLSLLVSTTRLMAQSFRGIIAGFLLGMAGAVSATLLVDVISESFDGVGQEVFNAVLLVVIVLLLIVYSAALVRRAATGNGPGSMLLLVSCLAVALAITREGTEIIIFVYGFASDPAEMLPVLVGGAIGAGIDPATLMIDGAEGPRDEDTLAGEYPRLYRNMAHLVAEGGIDMDLAPFAHVADAFMLGARKTVAPFEF